MSRRYLFITFTAIFIQKIASNSALPKISHEICALSDSACLKAEVEKVVGLFTEGNPDLGIEKLDEMKFDTLDIINEGLILKMKNVEITGLKNAIIDDIWFNTYMKYIHLTFHTTYNIVCDYKVDGVLFGMPVSGEGKAHMTKRNFITEMVIFYDIIKNKDGKDVIDLKMYRYGTELREYSGYKFENLFNGDEEKSNLVHDFLNKNWRTISDTFGEIFYNQINEKIFNAIKIYLGSFPLEDITKLN